MLLADEDEEALERTGALVEGLGHSVIKSAIDLAEATEAVEREDPDVSLVLVHSDDEHALSLIDEIGAFSRGPVIALLESAEPDFIRRAAERGLDAYARPQDPEAVQNAIEVALRRHAETERLNEQIQHLQTALDRRAVIERAKGVLMERHGIGEREAFEMLRAQARNASATVVSTAASVTDGRR